MAHTATTSKTSPPPASTFKPYVPATQSPAEFTIKAIVLGVLFGLIFGASTVYLGLRAGLTVSASIPIAVLAISVLKKLGGSTILENNIVQTIGSAGESLAAGVVFTIPALIFLVPYGPAYFNLGLLYLDADPFPSGGGQLDTMQRLNAAKGFFDQYKNMPGVDMKLYDERMKDVAKLIKREEKRRKKAGKGG